MNHDAINRAAGDPIDLCLAGASPDTLNLGVTALGYATLASVAAVAPHLKMLLFDDGWGLRRDRLESAKHHVDFTRCGTRQSRRYYRSECHANMRFCAKLGGLWNPGARALCRCRALWDVTGGDSFTDLYGERRFWGASALKRMALEAGIPLVFLPQTYGPFKHSKLRSMAREWVSEAAMAWARDARSFQALQELLGPDFDPQRHRCGVDMAFELPAIEPPEDWPGRHFKRWFDPAHPIIGLNVSGLIYRDPAEAALNFGLKVHYPQILREWITHLLTHTSAQILLVPHVMTPVSQHESDLAANHEIYSGLGGNPRVHQLPACSDPRMIKWVLGQLDWFCGTRMHSTIGALSMGVPTASLAYSLKTQGVFETLHMGAHVADMRSAGHEAILETLWNSWNSRMATRQKLSESLPEVHRRGQDQIRQMLAALKLPVAQESPQLAIKAAL